ncbi:MAG TPA: DNA primase [Gammaproteobacteria bacterium]|nr:DNA primase [Gammaproteobacteria bacterium]
MSGRIPRSFIDNLLNRVDIVEVIDSRVPLKKKGREFWACCPFHGEKTPSFSVSPAKQFYHCFGCQKSGNAIGFLMDYDHMEFVEAIETLAGAQGMEIPYEQGSARPSAARAGLDPMYAAMEQCAAFYEAELKQSQTAIDYLKNRGISGQTAKTFAIGYAPPGWNSLKGDSKILIEAGMLLQKDGGNRYDRFRNRLMFPIRDRRGRVIAFGGRVIDPEDNPKYLNSPESPLFHKSDEIYGLYEMRKAVTNIERIYITEGYMDVVALAEHGVDTAVATLGTAINNHQIESLFRVCRHLVFCFDGDAAGKKAAWRSLEACLASLKEGRLARFLFLPEGQDPDSYVGEFGKAAFEELVEQSSTLTQYLFETLLAECNIRSLEGRAEFLDRLRPYFGQIPLQSLKDQILAEVEQRIGQKVDGRMLRLLGAERPPREQQRRLPEQHWTPTRLAINLLFKKPALALGIGSQDALGDSGIKGVDLLLKILDRIHEDPGISTQNLLDRFKGEEHEGHLYKLAAMEPPAEDESLERMFADCLQQLQKQYIGERRKRLIGKLQSGEALTEAEKLEHRKLFTNRN